MVVCRNLCMLYTNSYKYLLLQDWDHDESYKIVTGVVSYGLQCGYFGVYTRVTYYLPWIEKKVLGRLTN